MDRNLRICLLGVTFIASSLAAKFLSVGSGLVVALSCALICGCWYGLNRFFPADAPEERKPEPPKRRDTEPSVLKVRPPTPRPRELSFSERQWSALANVLKAPSRTNLQKLGSGTYK